MSDIPPEGEALKFARSDTGRVHILSWVPGPDDDGYDPGAGKPATVAEALMAKARMLCGQRLFLPVAGVGGYHFEDDDLCVSCVRSLGGEAWRAFHRDSRGDGAAHD